MDEPFGALDELTRLEMNDLLLRIRRETKASVLFVTHSLEEAVYLSDRILVFSARPGRRVGDVAVDLPKPRYGQDVRSSIAFLETRKRVMQLLQEKTDYYRGDHAAVHVD